MTRDPGATREPARRPGRPRSERARQAILAAAMELAAEEGPASLHMEAIAKRAGVSKETLYRWWHSKTEVVLDAMAEYGQQAVPLPDTGTLLGDLREFLRATADSADPTTVNVLRHLAAAAAADESEAIQIRNRFLARRRAALGELLDRAVARGEIEAGYAALARDLIYGSLWYRLIFRVGPVDYTWAEDVAAVIATRTSPGALGSTSSRPASRHRTRTSASSSTTSSSRCSGQPPTHDQTGIPGHGVTRPLPAARSSLP